MNLWCSDLPLITTKPKSPMFHQLLSYLHTKVPLNIKLKSRIIL